MPSPTDELIEREHPLVKALGKIRTDHSLRGCVLVSFYGDRVGVNSSGEGEMFGAAMELLASDILDAINEGQFDPNTGEIDRLIAINRALKNTEGNGDG